MTTAELCEQPPGVLRAHVDHAAWPGVAHVPRAPIASAIARMLMRRAAGATPVRVTLPGGEDIGGGGPGRPRWRCTVPRTSSRGSAATC